MLHRVLEEKRKKKTVQDDIYIVSTNKRSDVINEIRKPYAYTQTSTA